MNKIVLFVLVNFIIVENVWSGDIRRDGQYPPPALLAKWKPIHDTCVGKTGVSEDVIKEFSDGQIIEDDKLKCYMDCLFTEMGLMLPNGKIDLVSFHESFSDDKEIHFTFIHMIRKCLYPQGDNACDRAYFLNKCWKQTDPKHYFLV